MGWNLRNYQHKQKSPKEINCLQVNNKTITDIKDIANEFNIHFTTLLKKWKKINQSTIWIYTLPTTTKLRFILDPTTKEEVQSEIKTQKNNKFFGPSSIPTKVTFENFFKWTHLIIANLYFETNTFPETLK